MQAAFRSSTGGSKTPLPLAWFLRFNEVFSREGNYYSASVEDSAELTMESIAVVANKFANVLKSHGTTKGSSVLLYAPNVVQLPVVLFACARIGATLTFVVSSLCL